MTKISLHKKHYRITLFIIGILATFAYRIIVVLNYYSQLYVSIAWYVGTIGFVVFFAHRYKIENRRNKLIKKHKLEQKISTSKELNQEEKDILMYILNSLKSSLAKYNYIAIFILSALALIYGIFNDLIIFFN